MFWSSFSASKLKSHLSMSCERLRLMENKRKNKIKIERKEIAALLKDKKWDKARIAVESVIRQTKEGEAGEILELMCDLLVQRIQLITNEKACPTDMQVRKASSFCRPPSLLLSFFAFRSSFLFPAVLSLSFLGYALLFLQECVQTVIWAAPRAQCEEMRVVREQLILKYGEPWCAPAVRGEGEGCKVNDKIKARLTVSILREEGKEWHELRCFLAALTSSRRHLLLCLFSSLFADRGPRRCGQD